MDLGEQYDKLLRYCYMKVRNRELAEDITQDAFVRFLGSKGYREQGREMAYLYTIARNLCADQYRKKKELLIEDLAPDMQNCFPAEDDPEERLITSLSIEQALDALTPEDREIVVLRYVNELSAAEIGKIMGISRFAVHRRLKAALKKLREELGE